MTDHPDTDAGRIVFDALGVVLSRLPEGARIAIAYSGGLDSSVLLDACVRLGGAARWVALHVHHGLSPNADAWAGHCAATAHALGVAYDVRRIDIAPSDPKGVEAAARDGRYRALEEMCAHHGAQSLWLAQHADDQAETVLLQLLRGAGLAGLAAMAPARTTAGAVTRVRPLLQLSRKQLEAYALAYDVRWVEDESNVDTRYARNALRNDVMPALNAHFPGYRAALARTATHAASAQRLLDDLAALDLREVAVDERGESLRHAGLIALDDARALNLLRFWMRSLGLPAASAARLADALRQLREMAQSERGAAGACVDHAGQRLCCYRGEVFWEVARREGTMQTTREAAELLWHGEEIWRLPQWRGTFVFAPTDADDPDAVPVALLARARLVARERSGGERMRDAGAGLSRTLKHLFQAQGVPAWERDVPLLFSGETLLFVPRIGVNRAGFADWPAGADVSPTSAGHSASASARADPADGWRRIEWREDLLIAH